MTIAATNPVAAMTRRELREMLTDWRIIAPVVVLAFFLPVLLAAAAGYVINFIEDTQLATALIPFAALLVGFIPASFSIITALESFVGERERNTLESLLSMPIADTHLYTSKLVSSLVPPILASYTSITIFSLLTYIIYPDLFANGINPARLLALYVLIGLLALCMVAGAVVISSHTSSIRAANLMSSFILLPTIIIIQLASFAIIAARWNALWMLAGGLVLLGWLLVRLGMKSFSREEILAREHQQPGFIVALRTLAQRLPGRRAAASGSVLEAAPAARAVSVRQHLQPLRTIRMIIEREMHETLSDWRVLLPVVILSLVVPAGLVAGTPVAVRFVENPRFIAQLVPFAILLVGFIPASFSLITALESFVGERERSSLEALLAMPISDLGLYSSKFLAAITTPVLTSSVAMGLFAVLMAWLHPGLYYFSMTVERFLILFVFIVTMIIVMVAAAVIISSHTSSIRAANLLASFVLVPVTIALQLQALLFIADRWDLLWATIAIMWLAAIGLLRTGMAAFNREEIISREHEQLNLHETLATFRLFFCEYQPAGILPTTYQRAPFSPWRFYRRELPALLRELRVPLLVALFAVVAGTVVGVYVAENFRLDELRAEILTRVGTGEPASPGLALYVAYTNLRVSILSNVLSLVSFGLLAFLVPTIAFAQLGLVSRVLEQNGGVWFSGTPLDPALFLLAYVLPHGIIELPTFVLSSAIGIRIGASVLSPPGAFSVGQNILWTMANFAKLWLLVLAPLVLLAATIEGLLTPLIVASLY